jgi:hypothetical protein
MASKTSNGVWLVTGLVLVAGLTAGVIIYLQQQSKKKMRAVLSDQINSGQGPDGTMVSPVGDNAGGISLNDQLGIKKTYDPGQAHSDKFTDVRQH